MPIKQRPGKARRLQIAELNNEQKDYLLYGFKIPLSNLFVDEDQEREAWETHRDELIAQYCEELGPFRRPWAWWRYESCGPRLCLSDPRNMIVSWEKLSYGIPSLYHKQPYPPDGPRYESTRSYLIRWRLQLTAEERILLRKSEDPNPNGVYSSQEQRNAEDWKEWESFCKSRNR